MGVGSNSHFARLGLPNPSPTSGFGNPEGAIPAKTDYPTATMRIAGVLELREITHNSWCPLIVWLIRVLPRDYHNLWVKVEAYARYGVLDACRALNQRLRVTRRNGVCLQYSPKTSPKTATMQKQQKPTSCRSKSRSALNVLCSLTSHTNYCLR